MKDDVFILVEHLRGQVAEITQNLLAAGRDWTARNGGRVVAVLLGNGAESLVAGLDADLILSVDHPALADFTSEAYSITLECLIKENQPRAVFFGNTSIGSDIAGGLSVKLTLPLVSSVKQFNPAGLLVSQICGGKIFAETAPPASTFLATWIPGGYRLEDTPTALAPEMMRVAAPPLDDLRVTLKGYLEQEAADVDISRESVLVAVGRGIQTQDNLELAEELAGLLGGVVSASRPIVDQGWLPISRMVGKSGQHVKPKVYLALGISGAPEHLEGIGSPEAIIAVNSDPQAPIFNVARYGIEMDMFDLFDPLIEHLEEAKG
jgi:electron transfer flavoprotein alpha subunit